MLAKKMGYRPDPEAARLMSYLKTSHRSSFQSVIGILNAFPNQKKLLESDYTRALLKGAEQRAHQLGYILDYLHLCSDGMTPRRLDQIIGARGIRGVLIPPEPDPLFKTTLNWSQIAAVATTTTAKPFNLHRVLPHNFQNFRLIFDTLIELGYRRICLIHWEELEIRQMSAATAIYALYSHIHKTIETLPIFEWNWSESEEVKRGRMAGYVKKYKPEVVLGFSDFNLKLLTEATGLKIPQEIGFVSYGESRGDHARLDQTPEVVGAAAIDMLSAHIQRGETGLPANPKTTLIEGCFLKKSTIRRIN